MTGFLIVVAMSLHNSMKSPPYASEKVLSFISFMSAPAAKALSDPVSTIAPMELSASRVCSAALSSRKTAVLSALSAFGLFNVTA